MHPLLESKWVLTDKQRIVLHDFLNYTNSSGGGALMEIKQSG